MVGAFIIAALLITIGVLVTLHDRRIKPSAAKVTRGLAVSVCPGVDSGYLLGNGGARACHVRK